ncbi:hypothetical protein H9L17_06885 [Thermomonas brevis]|uniref:Sulfotransferase n=1 Tax=Thermomonas brevis TaxID=215691 RepID=A0A7G9QWW7_9GAMM|nr:hypothetical protein [Thermomonas brevis]QNN47842.1 hypothetical protein H9L17_06885 [Thermomonas brevis]
MKPREFVLTGVPRAGTTLCCELLGRADDTVALIEPIPVHCLPLGHGEAVAEIRRFFEAERTRLLEAGTAASQQVDGRGTDNFFDAERRESDGMRIRKASLADIRIEKPLSADFTLVIKHNAAFAALLAPLATAIDCIAVVRNPLAVLASWNSVDLPVRSGRLPAGERLEPALAACLDAEPDALERQLQLLNWLFGRFSQCLPAERILRYEDVVRSGGGVLANASGIAFPISSLSSRNASRLYDAQACAGYAERLRRDDGAWRKFYGNEDVSCVLETMRAGG